MHQATLIQGIGGGANHPRSSPLIWEESDRGNGDSECGMRMRDLMRPEPRFGCQMRGNAAKAAPGKTEG
jgi:hypothetical protein